MAYIQGWQTYVGRGTQSAIGTGVTATKFQTQTNVTLGLRKPNQATVPVNRKARGKKLSISDRTNVDGTIQGPLMPDELSGGIMWADLLGNNNAVSGSAGVGFTHTFSEPTQDSHYATAGMTLETLFGGSDTTLMFDFIGCFLKSLELNFPDQGEVTFTASYVGKTVTTGGTVGSPTFTTKNPFVSSMVDIKIGATLGAVATVEWTSARFMYDNGVEMVPGGNSATPAGRAYPNHGECTVDITMNLTDSLTIYNYYANKTEIAIQIVITHTELAGTASGFHTITISLPRMLPKGEPPQISGSGLQPVTYTYEAMKGESEAYTVQVAVINSETGVYTA